MVTSRVKEIVLENEGISIAPTDQATQINALISRFRDRARTLDAGTMHLRVVNDPNDDPGSEVNILVHQDGLDATCVRVSRRYINSLAGRDGNPIADNGTTRRMSLSTGPVHFIGEDGQRIERIIFRDTN